MSLYGHRMVLPTLTTLALASCSTGVDGSETTGSNFVTVSASAGEGGEESGEESGEGSESGGDMSTSSDPTTTDPGMTTTEDTDSDSATTMDPTAGTTEGDTDTDTDTGTETGDPPLPPLPCDDRFNFPEGGADPASAGVPFTARFTDDIGHVYIGMIAAQVEGAGSPSTSNETISGSGPYNWTYTVNGHGAGVIRLTFISDPPNDGMSAEVLGECELYVE